MVPHRTSASHRTEERGSALLITVLLTMVVAALGTTVIIMSNTNHLISANERDSERALFASRAGLEYGYYLFEKGLLAAGSTTTTFDSAAPAVRDPLDGAGFNGTISHSGTTTTTGQTYTIRATGTYRRAARTTEVVVGVVPEQFKYGYVAFDEMQLHRHNTSASAANFRVRSTIFSNGHIDIPMSVTLDGTVISGGFVQINTGARLKSSLFANRAWNGGTIDGKARMLTAVDDLPDSATSYDRIDNHGKKYKWFNGQNDPGDVGGPGTIAGGKSSYLIKNGDEFKYNIFRKDGRLMQSPDLNVIKYIPPPKVDFKAMRDEALRYEPTYFANMTAAMSYLAGKKVTEVIDGKTVTTIKVGNDTFPEFLYVNGNFTLRLDPTVALDNPNAGVLKADGFHLEGGIFAAGNLSLNGPTFDPALQPAAPSWYQFKINALPYCFPALVAYKQPAYGSIDSWTSDDTPVMSSSGSQIAIDSSHTAGGEGSVYLNGLTLSQFETHLDHRNTAGELIHFNGAELAFKVHNCDYFEFTYDPLVRCSGFLDAEPGAPQVVSYREVR